MTRRRIPEVAYYIICLLTALAGGALLALSLLPADFYRERVSAFVLSSNFDLLGPDYIASLLWRLRIAGVGLLLLGAVLLLLRRRVLDTLSEAAASLPDFVRDCRNYLSGIVRDGDRGHLYALLAVLVVAVLVRLAFLSQPVRNDEAFTFLRYASQPLYVGLSKYTTPNNHLFHTLLVHLSYMLFGNNLWALRLPAMLAGVLMVPATYLVGRAIYSKHVALVGAALAASSSPLIEYSTNARGYTLVVLFFLLVLGLLAYLTHRHNSVGWLLFALLTALGFYTVPVMLYPFGVALVWLAGTVLTRDIKVPRAQLVRGLALSLQIMALLILLLYLPVLIVSGPGALLANPFVGPRTTSALISQIPGWLGDIGAQWTQDMPLAVTIALLAGAVVATILHSRLSGRRFPLSLAVLLWCVPLLVVQRVLPFARVWLFLLPLYYLLAGAGLVYLGGPFPSRIRQIGRWVLPATAVLAAVWLSYDTWRAQSVGLFGDIGTLAQGDKIAYWLKSELEPGDGVLTSTASESCLAYYLDREGVSTSFMYSGLADKERLWVVVNSPGATLEAVLREAGVSLPAGFEPEPVNLFGAAQVYELDRFTAEAQLPGLRLVR